MKPITTVCITACTAIMLLSSCSNKPPGCGEDASLDTLKGLIVDEVKKDLTNGNQYKADPLPFDAYLKSLSLNVSMVTTDGYNDAAQKHMCHGRLDIATGNQSGKFDIDYSVQNVEDKRGEFVVTLQQAQFIIDQLKANALQNWYALRFSGTWRGIYSCEGIGGALNGNQAGFQQDATITIADGGNIKLERTTRGGGFEKLAGTIDEQGQFQINGSGRNTPDDTWLTSFTGEAKPTAIVAQGRIMEPASGRTLRNCQLQLKRLSIADSK